MNGRMTFQMKRRIMWWVVSPPAFSKSFIPLIPKSTGPLFTISFSVNPKPPGVRRSSAVPRSQKQEGTKQQLSGLDVLWAMQKAAAEKNKVSSGGTEKKKKKRKGIRSAQEEEDDVDYSVVKPLCIKNDWGARLDELEKSLEELSDTK